MNKFNIDFLFGCPIYRVKIDPKSFNKEKMVKTIEANYKLDPVRNKWDYAGSDFHHSYADFKNKKFKWVDLDSIIRVYKKVFDQFYVNVFKGKGKCTYSFNITNYTAVKKGQYMRSHDHLPDADFSCIHYLKFNSKEHTRTKYINPAYYSRFMKFMFPKMHAHVDNQYPGNSFMFDEWSLPIEEDDFIIAPSVLIHEIPKQKETKDIRMTIVTNVSIVK